MCLSVGKSENVVTGNAARWIVNVPFYFMLAVGFVYISLLGEENGRRPIYES